MAEPTPERIEGWRAETPGAAHRTHLNNAGAALMPEPVIAAQRDHLALEVVTGGYEAADLRAEAVEESYRAVARLIGARPGEIAVVENATVAVAQALSCFDFAPGDVIVTSLADYVSNQLMLLSLAKRVGVVVRRAADLPEGGVDPASVAALLQDPRVRLVVLSWIPTNSGLIQDAAAVGALCRERGIPFLLDACQALGQLPIDVAALGCDFLAATARKFLRGPRGVGVLYVSERILQSGRWPLYLDLRGGTWTGPDAFEPAADARRFENWEFGYGQLLGLGAAAGYAALAETAGASSRSLELGALARGRLGGIDGVRVLDRGRRIGAIATFAIDGIDPGDLVTALRRERINTSWFPRSAAVIDADAKGVSAGWRVSPHYYNTAGEIDLLAEVLGEAIRTARRQPIR